MPIEIDYANQPIEKSIRQFEAATLGLFDTVMGSYNDLHEISDTELFASLRLPRNNLNAAHTIYAFFASFQKNYRLDKGHTMAYYAKALFSDGKLYRATQALSAFRQKYYSQLTTSDSDLNFSLQGLKEISAICNFFYESTVIFSPASDEIIKFLYSHSPLVFKDDEYFYDLQESIAGIITNSSELEMLFKQFFRHIKIKMLMAVVQHVDTEARELGINVSAKDCTNLASLLIKLRTAPKLTQILLELATYTTTPDRVALFYTEQVRVFDHFLNFQSKLATEHLSVIRCLAISQNLNIVTKFSAGNCEGGAATLLHSDLSQYYSAPRLNKFATYKDLDNFSITKDMFTRQSNQFTKSQTNCGEYFALITHDQVYDIACSSIISKIYIQAYNILKFSSEIKANIIVHLCNDDIAHAIAFHGYSLNADDSINFLFIDLNFGLFRFKLFQSESHQQPVVNWLNAIFSTYYTQFSYFQIIQHYIKSPTQKLYSQTIEQNLNLSCKAQAILANHLTTSNYAARYDAQKRNKIYATLNAHDHGNCNLQQLSSAQEEYLKIVDKTLVDHLHGLILIVHISNWHFEMNNYSATMTCINQMQSIQTQQAETLLGKYLAIGLPVYKAVVQEKLKPGSGREIIAALLIEQQSINAEQKLLDILGNCLKVVELSYNELCKLAFNLTDYFSEKFNIDGAHIEESTIENYFTGFCKTNDSMLDFCFAVTIAKLYDRLAIVDENHQYYSVLAQDKPNLRIVRAETKLPITLLFSPNPERPISCANDSYENTNQQLTVYKPRI